MDIYQILNGLYCYVVFQVVQVLTIRISEQACDADCIAVYSAPSQSHHHTAERGHTGKPADIVGICLSAPGFVATCSGPQMKLFFLCHAFSDEFTLQPFPWVVLSQGVSSTWLSCVQDLSYPCNLSPSMRLAEIDQWVQELLKDTPMSLPANTGTHPYENTHEQAHYDHTHLFS